MAPTELISPKNNLQEISRCVPTVLQKIEANRKKYILNHLERRQSLKKWTSNEEMDISHLRFLHQPPEQASFILFPSQGSGVDELKSGPSILDM